MEEGREGRGRQGKGSNPANYADLLLLIILCSMPKLFDFYTLTQIKLPENHTLHSHHTPIYLGVTPLGVLKRLRKEA